MGEAKKALSGNTVTMITGPYNGYRGIALEDAGQKNFFRVRITEGPYKNSIVKIQAGTYIVGPN